MMKRFWDWLKSTWIGRKTSGVIAYLGGGPGPRNR